MDVPGRIGHDHVELTQNLEVEVTQVAVYPFCMRHTLPVDSSFLGTFQLLVLFDVVDEFAVGVVAGIEVGAIAKRLVSILVDYGTEVFFVAVGMSLCLLALIARAVIAVLQILLRLKL